MQRNGSEKRFFLKTNKNINENRIHKNSFAKILRFLSRKKYLHANNQ